MALLGYAVLAFAPGVFWLWFFVRRDIYRPEPRRLLALTFFLGMLSTIPAGILNTVFIDYHMWDGAADFAAVASAMLLIVGPAEELSKFLVVRLGPFRSLYFDEPGDGLVYAAAASLGFASLENLIYILNFGPEVMLGRAPISTLAHVIFGSFWGYGLGLQTQEGRRSRRLWLAGSLIIAAAVHGLFNVLVFSAWPLALILVALGLWWTLGRFRWAQRISPFRYRRNYPRIACSACGQLNSIVSRYCQSCGRISPAANPLALVCSNCGNGNRADAGYCTRCGDRLLQ